ncbi:cell division protein anillin domain-containing protein [Sarocladium implicatum]|nr:cell division protein anillin domain-containing protein [Sarocladium implicatum]
MSSDPQAPLRISRAAPSPSPTKMASGLPRPLSELSPSEKRRNSPSWHQASPTKQKMPFKTDSSPFQSSPLESVTSPRLFWQNRNTENSLYGGRDSPSPTRRSSIERLQRASRVKNSNILALEQKQEYDPTRIPQIERPLAKVQGNAFGASNSSGLRSPGSERDEHDFMSPETKPQALNMSPSKAFSPDSAEESSTPRTPSKEQNSPFKSSLSPSKFKSSFDPETGIWSAESSFDERELPNGRSLHRHAKSVTFDAAPPQINEYEMATPDLSSIGSNSREGSYDSMDDEYEERDLYDPALMHGHDDSFDASLEDTDKTPVVGPDEWRGDSPQVRNTQPGHWESSPMPESAPTAADSGRAAAGRNGSTNSNGDHRPLPPLPGVGHARTQSNGSNPASPGLSATAERMLGNSRSLPSPPPASASKVDIQNIGNGKMTLEERLKLMMLSDDNNGKSAAELQRERRLRRGNGRDRFESPVASEPDSVVDDAVEAGEADDTVGDISVLEDYQLPQRISRESIMRRVNGNNTLTRESDYNFSSPAPSSSPQRSPVRSPERQLPLDPDVPIPSVEDSIVYDEEDEGSVIITRDPEDYQDDVLDLYQHSDAEYDRESDQIRDDDSQSHYSDNNANQPAQVEISDEVHTPRASTPTKANALNDCIPSLGPSTRYSEFSRDFESYMLPEEEEPQKQADLPKQLEPEREEPKAAETDAPKMVDVPILAQRPHTPEQPMSKPEYDGSGWGDPEDEFADEPGTPDSVIHHPMPEEEDEEEEPFVERELPAVPEREATIKASGSKLKTRASNTPADLAAMREARRQVSYEVPDVPPIPQKHRNRLSRDMGVPEVAEGDEYIERHPSFKKRSLTLDLDLGLSLDQDFERVIEAQKRGYLMRQNTKLVAASDKDREIELKTRSVGNSPVKGTRPESWTVEPWNGKVRPNSTRTRPAPGPVPPLPGLESNAAALKEVPEEDIQAQIATPESGERGRLFVKVMGVKDLDLPIPRNERSWFSLTLDNGVHCVTTAWLELARNAPIGQEFELVVPNDLEFQLTLNVKLEKPAPSMIATVGKGSKPKGSTFSRVFASPKKRKEMELRQREEDQRAAQQKRESELRARNVTPTAYELLSPLAAEDGSFARSYVCLKEHENRCFGRPYMAEVACFNEWATEEAGFASSVKSKRGNTAVVRKAPYKIGKLELQLLFVPRPKNATDDDMPKSMNSCIRELKAAEERMSRNWEGHLSQQGGDCPYWRRRYFKLVGTKLTAYHEATRQPRATINLANAKRLIDDRQALTEKETLVRGGKRRRSAFAEEEEGYMFVEEGFRIRFNNGEVIDFYADTAEDKESWMKVLSEVIGRGDNAEDEVNGVRSRAKWCELVLKREEQLRRRASGRRVHSRTKSTYN